MDIHSQKGDHIWMIDGVEIHLKHSGADGPLSDTEEEAGRVLAEAQSPADLSDGVPS